MPVTGFLCFVRQQSRSVSLLRPRHAFRIIALSSAEPHDSLASRKPPSARPVAPAAQTKTKSNAILPAPRKGACGRTRARVRSAATCASASLRRVAARTKICVAAALPRSRWRPSPRRNRSAADSAAVRGTKGRLAGASKDEHMYIAHGTLLGSLCRTPSVSLGTPLP